MEQHTIKDDWIAILTGTFLTAQGLFFLQSAQLLTGGVAGLTLLLTQFLPISFGTLFFLMNCPFYLMAWRRFGKAFAFRSLISGVLVSVFTDHIGLFIELSTLNKLYCAVSGGLLMGLGMLILFRHRSSLGGFNVMCLLIQDKTGISVGKTQLAIDGLILTASFIFVSPWIILYSILGAVILNLVLAMNHKPSRYIVNYG
jgi:uncharacterized membrane-anchored protein YitT (DUF2179 family)